MFGECPQNVYDQINKSIFYAQLYYVRSGFKYDLLTSEQKYFLKMNEDLSFYSGAAFLSSQSDGVIQISNIYNSDTTSMQVVSPSVNYNYTEASYQTCNGNDYIEPYDARCRFWFQYASQNSGIFIYQPYNDALTSILILSLSSGVNRDSKFYSVHTINFVMQNLVPLFNSYLSLNSYSILFHEFNTTVLYHPLLFFNQKMTWIDVEFLNINQICNDSQDHMELCLQQKQHLSKQINQTIQFIQTGNYSIDNQENLEMLYQRWERFGQKQQIFSTFFFCKQINSNLIHSLSKQQIEGGKIGKLSLIKLKNFIQIFKNGWNFLLWDPFTPIEFIEFDFLHILIVNNNQIFFVNLIKRMSIVFPIQSKIKGLNNQHPYSFAILMIARVITDNSDQLKLFNLINTNMIEVYLLVEFAILSSLILIFIINYGFFLVYQISNPLDLLTLFLTKSYQDQLTSHINVKQSNLSFVKKQINKKQQKKSPKPQNVQNNQKRNSCKQNLFQQFIQNEYSKQTQTQKMIDQSHAQISKEEYSPDLSQNCIMSNLQSKQIQYFADQSKSQNNFLTVQRVSHQKSELNLIKDSSTISIKKIQQSSEKINENSQHANIIQKNSGYLRQSFSANKNNISLNTSNIKGKMQRSTNSEQEYQLSQKKQEDSNQILKGLKPLFLEMKIIKEVFQDLEKLINYSIDAQNLNSQNSTKTLFHFSLAKSTFQQLKNQIGLGRCYFNLGIISLLNKDYSLAEEYFESAIFLTIQTLGIDYQNIVNHKVTIIKEKNNENQILILSKRIFSKAYCLKQKALNSYYNFDQILNEGYLSSKKNKIINLKVPQQMHSYEIIQLLKQSLESFQIVLNFVENNSKSYSEKFKIFLFQEMTEILIFLSPNKNNNKQINKFFKKVENILNNFCHDQIVKEILYKTLHEERKNKSLVFIIENKIELNIQLIQIQKSKQFFLLGLVEQFKNNNSQAIQYYTQSIEEGIHYNPILRKKVAFHLAQLFKNITNIPFQQILDQEDYTLFKQQSINLDLVVLIQLNFYRQNPTVENWLKAMQEANILKEKDRIQIIIYHSDLDIFMPFTIINNTFKWSLVINSLKEIEKIIVQNEKQQLNWKDAIIQTLNQLYEINQFNLEIVKQNIQKNKNQLNNNKDILTKIFQNENKKVILLFSKDQNTDQQIQNNQIVKINQKFILNQKPIVYHLKEYAINQTDKQYFNSSKVVYEQFYDENQLIQNLKYLRNEHNSNEEQEFLAVLNNS